MPQVWQSGSESHRNSAGSNWILEPSVSTRLSCAADCSDPALTACFRLMALSSHRYVILIHLHSILKTDSGTLVLHLSLGSLRETVHALFTAPHWYHLLEVNWDIWLWISLYLWWQTVSGNVVLFSVWGTSLWPFVLMGLLWRCPSQIQAEQTELCTVRTGKITWLHTSFGCIIIIISKVYQDVWLPSVPDGATGTEARTCLPSECQWCRQV